ncbi:hypothetical protein RI367_001071 [Sorochytrium milnesiophthora]
MLTRRVVLSFIVAALVALAAPGFAGAAPARTVVVERSSGKSAARQHNATEAAHRVNNATESHHATKVVIVNQRPSHDEHKVEEKPRDPRLPLPHTYKADGQELVARSVKETGTSPKHHSLPTHREGKGAAAVKHETKHHRQANHTVEHHRKANHTVEHHRQVNHTIEHHLKANHTAEQRPKADHAKKQRGNGRHHIRDSAKRNHYNHLRLPKRTMPSPLSVTAAGSRVQWCCKERGKCLNTECARIKKGNMFLYGGVYRTQDDCVNARCRQVCFKTTRSCSTFF